MYKTRKEREAEERMEALLWLFIHSKGLGEEFTEFCRQRQGCSPKEIDEELKTLTIKQNAL